MKRLFVALLLVMLRVGVSKSKKTSLSLVYYCFSVFYESKLSTSLHPIKKPGYLSVPGLFVFVGVKRFELETLPNTN